METSYMYKKIITKCFWLKNTPLKIQNNCKNTPTIRALKQYSVLLPERLATNCRFAPSALALYGELLRSAIRSQFLILYGSPERFTPSVGSKARLLRSSFSACCFSYDNTRPPRLSTVYAQFFSAFEKNFACKKWIFACGYVIIQVR